MTPKETFEAYRNSKFKPKPPSLMFNMEMRALDVPEVRAIIRNMLRITPIYTQSDRDFLKSLSISTE